METFNGYGMLLVVAIGLIPIMAYAIYYALILKSRRRVDRIKKTIERTMGSKTERVEKVFSEMVKSQMVKEEKEPKGFKRYKGAEEFFESGVMIIEEIKNRGWGNKDAGIFVSFKTPLITAASETFDYATALGEKLATYDIKFQRTVNIMHLLASLDDKEMKEVYKYLEKLNKDVTKSEEKTE